MSENKMVDSKLINNDLGSIIEVKTNPSLPLSMHDTDTNENYLNDKQNLEKFEGSKSADMMVKSKSKSHSVDRSKTEQIRLDHVRIHSFISQQSSVIDRESIKRASVEHTLAMIKPDGMIYERKISTRFKKEGFIILAKRRVHLTPEQVSDFYHDLYGYKHFPLLVASTSSAPVAVYCLGRPDAVEKLKEVVGPCNVQLAKREYPDCLNAQFGNADCNFPAVHASCDPVSARREIQYFFPQGTIEQEKLVLNGLEFLAKEVQPLLKEGLTQVLKAKPAEPLLWLAGWLLEHNPRQPHIPEHLRHQHFYPSK